MSYKLYDFEDEELDEQLRLLADVLYNHRFQYANQVGTGNGGTGFPRPVFDGVNLFHLMHWVDGAIVSTNLTNHGFTFGTSSNSHDFEASYGLFTNTVTAGQELVSPAASFGAGRQLRYNPYMQTWIKTPSALTNWADITSWKVNQLYDANTPTVGISWVYDPSRSDKWAILIQTGSGDAYIDYSELPDVAVDTQYFFTSQFTKTGTDTFTCLFGVQIETRDGSGDITYEETFSFTETLTLDEDVNLRFRPLVSNNTGGSGNVQIKFHSSYYEQSRGI